MNDACKVNLLAVLTKLEAERIAAQDEQLEAKDVARQANAVYNAAEERYRKLCNATDSITDILRTAGVSHAAIQEAIDAADPDPLPDAIDPGEMI